MRTTLELDENLVAEVVKLTGEKSKSKAVNRVLAEHVRQKKLDQLWNLAGKLDLADNWYELRHMEPR